VVAVILGAAGLVLGGLALVLVWRRRGPSGESPVEEHE
jgi:hypothetical protein